MVDAGGRGFWGEDQSGRTVGRKRWRFRKIRIDIAGYHGWNIYSYDGDIIAVTDQDDHSVAISNVLSIDVRVDKHWYYKDGESIEFRDDYFQYRRAGEDEWHDICPEYFGNILWFKLGIRR